MKDGRDTTRLSPYLVIILDENAFDEGMKLFGPLFATLKPGRRVPGDEEQGPHRVHITKRWLGFGHLQSGDACEYKFKNSRCDQNYHLTTSPFAESKNEAPSSRMCRQRRVNEIRDADGYENFLLESGCGSTVSMLRAIMLQWFWYQLSLYHGSFPFFYAAKALEKAGVGASHRLQKDFHLQTKRTKYLVININYVNYIKKKPSLKPKPFPVVLRP